MNPIRLAAVLAALSPLAGCGDPRAEVRGTVTLKNQPVPSAVVNFFPDQGMPVAATVVDGAFTVPNVPYGSYRVTVIPLAAEPAVTTGPGGPRKPGKDEPGAKAAPAPRPAVAIPGKYGSVDSSGLSCKVDQPTVTHPIALD